MSVKTARGPGSHALIISSAFDYTAEFAATVALFDHLEIANYSRIDRDLYRWIARHLINLIYDGLVECTPCAITIGDNHYNLIIQE